MGSAHAIVEQVERSGADAPWLLDLQVLFSRAMAAVTNAAAVDGDARQTRFGAAKQARQLQPKRFRMNLFQKGDFASQKTTFWCIPASTQMMMNMMDGGKANRSRARRQPRDGYHRLGRPTQSL